jgi:ribose transport system substrate-binding protein
LGARELAGLLGGKGKVATILHAPGSFSTMDREKGFRQVLDAEFPALEVVGEQFSMGDQAKARDITENLLSAHPGLQGIFCSTEPSATGALLALEARGLAGKVKLVNVDSSENLIELMKQDKVHALVVQDPFGMAHKAVSSLVSKMEGRTPPRRVDLEPRVVTKGNLDNPEVIRLLKPDIAKYR